MKYLYLLRHGKSSWKDPTLRDHDRPLAGRGRRAAKAIAKHIREQGIAPELVICSTARRARQTLEGIEPARGTRTVQVEEQVYLADANALLERLRRVPDQLSSVLLIGHNPALHDLALELARPGSKLHGLDTKYPTGALVTLSFDDSSWRDLDRGRATVAEVVRPRDLQ
jgi:phosphohistidine phosphatase